MEKLLLIFTICWLLLSFSSVQAATLEIPLPGMPKTISDPGTYVRYLFIFGLSLIGFLAVGAIIIGGIQYMLAGSIGSVEKARQTIIGALSGVALLLCSYLLLTTIDPTLTNLSLRGLENINIPPHEGFTFTDQEIKTSNIAKGDYSNIINAMATKYNVPPNLIKAIIMAESGGNAGAKSGVGAQGLMQLMPDTAKELKVKDPFDPAQNIEGGTKYVSRLLKRYSGDASKALAAYNWGMGNVERKGMNSLPSETQKYIPKVMRYWNDFENKA
jgi:hypothetical protein